MAGAVSSEKATRGDRAGCDAGQVPVSESATVCTSCNALITKCPGVSRLCPGENIQIEFARFPIGKAFSCLSRLSRLSRHKTVGVGRKSPATGARVWGGQRIYCAVNGCLKASARVLLSHSHCG